MFEQMLNTGMHVEVTSNEDGFRGAWYVAKIIQAPKLMDKYVQVEYNELVTEDDVSKKLIERVHVSFVRPLPPVGKGLNEVIEVNDVVDSFYNDGWWIGVVDDVVDDGRKFVVCFDNPHHTMMCRRSDVRVHFDWIDGKWEKAKKKKQRGRPKKQLARKGYASTNISNDTEKEDDIDVADDIVGKECIAEEADMSVKEVEGTLLPANYCKTPPKKDQKNKSRDRKMHTVEITKASNKGDSGVKRKRGRPRLFPKKEIGEGSTGAKGSSQKMVTNDSCVEDEAEKSAEKHCLILATVDKPNEDHFQPLSRNSMMGTDNKQRTTGVHRHNVLSSETAIIPFLEDQVDETVLIKRVKRRKNSLSSAHNEMSKIVESESRYQECDNASRGDSLHEIYHSKDADMPIDEMAAELNEDQVNNSRIQLDKPCSTDSEYLRALHVQRQCANANGMQNDFGTPVVKKDRVEKGPDQETDGSIPGDLPVKSLSRRAGSNDKGGKLGTPPASVCIDNVENNQSLPFLKGSPLWKNIESMEIFKKAAKKPHFSPLVKCKEEFREGLALGFMVNFSNLVKNISKLQFRHPITVIESRLGILDEYESHGFDVEIVRACLTRLLSKKQREAELQKEYQDIGNTISNRVAEISKTNEEITNLNKKIRELTAKLDDTVSKKEMKESEISTLQSKQDVVGQNIQSLQTDFENIAGDVL